MEKERETESGRERGMRERDEREKERGRERETSRNRESREREGIRAINLGVDAQSWNRGRHNALCARGMKKKSGYVVRSAAQSVCMAQSVCVAHSVCSTHLVCAPHSVSTHLSSPHLVSTSGSVSSTLLLRLSSCSCFDRQVPRPSWTHWDLMSAVILQIGTRT